MACHGRGNNTGGVGGEGGPELKGQTDQSVNETENKLIKKTWSDPTPRCAPEGGCVVQRERTTLVKPEKND